MNAGPVDAWLQDWPADDLQAVPVCAVCRSARRKPWLSDLRDRIFRVAPGRWSLWRCEDCGAATLDPRPTDASLGRAYASYYTHEPPVPHPMVPGDLPRKRRNRALYAGFYNATLGYRLPDAATLGAWWIGASARRRTRAEHAIRHLPAPPPGGRLLDFGCGNGSFLRVARALGYEAGGVEFDPAAAALVREQGFDVQVGSWTDVSVAPGSIDQLMLSHVIEHLDDPVAALGVMRGWLKPGGRVWLQTPNADAVGAQTYGADWRGLEPPRHLVLFTPASLERALQAAGFERCELLRPTAEALFYIEQSEAIRAGVEVAALPEDRQRAARAMAGAWDQRAQADPHVAESVTMVAWRA